jgi:hypothetical protein
VFVFLVTAAVGLLDQRKAARLVEPARLRVALKGPELQPIRALLCDLEQRTADPAALCSRQHIKLLDPVVAKGNHAAHRRALEPTPQGATDKHPLAIEPAILLRRMQPCEPRQRMVERRAMHARGGIHVRQREPSETHCTLGFAESSIPSAFMTAIVVFKVGLPLLLNER